MSYRIIIEKPAMKFLEKQPQAQRDRLLKAIYKLPDVGDIRRLMPFTGLYRLRVGTVRVIFTVENDVLIVRVVEIDNRGDVYK